MANCIITTVTDVRPLGDNLSVVTVEGSENSIVANKQEDGSFRWSVGEIVVYVPEGAILTDDTMKYRGYWDEETEKGLLGGKSNNQVKKRNFGPTDDRVESRGLLFKVEDGPAGEPMPSKISMGGGTSATFNVEDDPTEFLEISF